MLRIAIKYCRNGTGLQTRFVVSKLVHDSIHRDPEGALYTALLKVFLTLWLAAWTSISSNSQFFRSWLVTPRGGTSRSDQFGSAGVNYTL